jgi:catechol 2,3-dioxygenase-like lactoylglutathione lyase family enzyme
VRGVHGFDFGELAVNEVHQHGPDGMVLSIIEQLKPALALAAPKLTHVFNAAIIVRDFGRARDFFVEKLGFKPWMEVEWNGDNPGLTLLSDLTDFQGVKTIKTVIVHPQGENLGSVELIGWDGAAPGRDFSERAHPPNLGSLALRFGVDDLAAHLDRLRSHGISPVRPVTELTLEPYGRVRLAPIRSPDGVWLEFFEVLG